MDGGRETILYSSGVSTHGERNVDLESGTPDLEQRRALCGPVGLPRGSDSVGQRVQR